MIIKTISISNDRKFFSSPIIGSDKVADSELRKVVESIGPTKWWVNNISKTPGVESYSFRVTGPNKSSFDITLDEHRNVRDFIGRIYHDDGDHLYTDTSPIEKLQDLLNAINKDSTGEIIKSLQEDLGLTENN